MYKKKVNRHNMNLNSSTTCPLMKERAPPSVCIDVLESYNFSIYERVCYSLLDLIYRIQPQSRGWEGPQKQVDVASNLKGNIFFGFGDGRKYIVRSRFL